MAEASDGGLGQNSARRIAPERILAQLEKILCSPVFMRSDRLCRFLRYTVKKALQGHEADLKEYPIGIEVFDRPESFDPRLDSIVRVEARRLRLKLELYYETDGATDDLVIEFRKGSYVPYFHLRHEIYGHQLLRKPRTRSWRPWRAIAVLPFTLVGPRQPGSWFSDGAMEEIISALSRLPGFRVVARTSSARYGTREQNPRKVGREVNADLIVTGSMRTLSSEKIRVTVQVADVWEGLYIWSGSFEMDTRDPFRAQQELARLLVERLELEAVCFGGDDLSAEPVADAVILTRRGWQCLERLNTESLIRAVSYFHDAILAEADHLPAHAGLAQAWALLALAGGSFVSQARADAPKAARRALSLDESSPEANVAMGLVHWILEGDWERAERRFEVALQADENFAPALGWLGVQHLTKGEVEEALAELQVLERLDLNSVLCEFLCGVMKQMAGDEAGAEKVFRGLIRFDPALTIAYLALSANQLRRGHSAEALEMLEQACQLAGNSPFLLGCLGYAAGLSNNRDRTAAILADLAREADRLPDRDLPLAMVHAGLGNYDQAERFLYNARLAKDPQLLCLSLVPHWANWAGQQARGHAR